jgi:DNA-binding winged helix-turn-helix (wHTH) protein
VAAPNRKAPIPHDISVHRRRHKIENMFGRPKVSSGRILGRGAIAPPDQHSEEMKAAMKSPPENVERMYMTDEQSAPAADLISFGPFRLCPAHRNLEKAGSPIHLGARAFDILIVLVELAGEVVSKKKLMARVWPDVTVEEGNLRFHIAALRKALEDGQSGARYVTTIAGRGYCFVAPISRSNTNPRSVARPA